jgi:hypothetical protein
MWPSHLRDDRKITERRMRGKVRAASKTLSRQTTPTENPRMNIESEVDGSGFVGFDEHATTG